VPVSQVFGLLPSGADRSAQRDALWRLSLRGERHYLANQAAQLLTLVIGIGSAGSEDLPP
jgi:hypothetical protein